MVLLKSILKKNNSPKMRERKVTFGENTIHNIPNRFELVRTGELEKITINGITLRHSDISNDYKKIINHQRYVKIGRFNVKRKIGRFTISS